MTSPVLGVAEAGTATRFGVLGPLLAVDDTGAHRVVSAPKQRILLAALLFSSGGVVSAENLAEALWDASPPPNAAAVMRTYVMRLRRALGPAGTRIVGRPTGWAVELRDSEELDLAEVDGLWRAGRAAAEAGEWRQVSSLLDRALSLWRGEPLVDVPSAALARRELARLAELRLQLTEARIDADLRLGRHGELVAELRRLATEHPLRERLRAQLMLACYGSGHQAAALEVYRDARKTLAEELGVEPGYELREMHRKILAAQPELAAAVPEWGRAVPAQRPDSSSRMPGRADEPFSPVVPRQLPAPVRNFVGRATELKRLSALAEEAAGGWATVVISAIGGMAGAGKTALAVHFAHQAVSRFPDGQLYVNLRGFGPSGTPVASAEALRGFLGALGMAAEQVPAGLEAQVGLYRSLTADRRLLIVLDNAHDVDQVRPLLPGSPGCLVLVTSRATQAGLAVSEGAELVALDVLADEEAYDLLSGRLGAERVAAEPAAVSELIRLCARLPLALAVAAARAAGQPAQPLAAVAAELREAEGRLDALDAGDPAASVRAVFSWSYQQLSSEAARLFRLQGIHPGPDITAPASASLAGCGPGEVRRLLGELTGAHLLAEHVPGRYACHDLLRAYAADLAHATDGHAECGAASRRMLQHYLHTAGAAALLLNPSRKPVTLDPIPPGVTPERLDDYQQALTWFEAERQVLISAVSLAARAGFDACAWQLPWAMSNFLDWQGHWHEWAAIERTAVGAATRLGDLGGQSMARRALASAYTRLGDYDQAGAHLADCLELGRQSGDRSGQASVLQTLSWLFGEQGRYADALGHAKQALALFQAIGNHSGQASALNNAGWYHIMLGQPQQARTLCRQALALHRRLGEHHGQASSWDSLGYAEHHLGNHAEAARCYSRALSVYRQLGNRQYEANTLIRLGDTRSAGGDIEAAREAWQQALVILDDLEHPDAAQVRAKLGQPTASARPRGRSGS